MPYIGKDPVIGEFIELDALTASATADYTLTRNGAAYKPATVNNLLVSINGVIQAGSTMSLNGNTLTVGATLSSSDTIDFVRVLGSVGNVSEPTDGSVTSAKLANDIAVNTLDVATIRASNGTTAATIDSSGRILQPAKPIFFAQGGTDSWQTAPSSTATITTWGVGTNTAINRGFTYSNGVVTFPVAGVYEISSSVLTETNAGEYVALEIKHDSVRLRYSQTYQLDSGRTQDHISINAMCNAAAGDTVFITIQGGGSSPQYHMGGSYAHFSVKLIG